MSPQGSILAARAPDWRRRPVRRAHPRRSLPLEPNLYHPPRPAGARAPGRRLFVDSRGVEWEVLDEGNPDAAMLMEWDMPAQRESPGLIFSSRADYRRLWPRPDDWSSFSDVQLEALCTRARSIL